jgi:hypothetical protein
MSNEPSVRPERSRSIKVTTLALAVGAGLVAGVLVGYLAFSTRSASLAVLVTIPASSKGDCLNLPPVGHRPLCAHTIWNGLYDTCSIDDLQASTCACYEGQVRSCVIAHPNFACPGGDGCGHKTCSVTDDTNSVWGPCAAP